MTLVNGSQLARHLRVSRQLISKAAKGGKIRRRPDGKFDLDKAVEQLRSSIVQPKAVGTKLNGAPGAPAGWATMPTLVQSKTAEAAFKARMARLDLEERQGKVIDAQQTREAIAAMISRARAKLLLIGEELMDRLAATSDPVYCRELVDDKMYEALGELAEYPARG